MGRGGTRWGVRSLAEPDRFSPQKRSGSPRLGVRVQWLKVRGMSFVDSAGVSIPDRENMSGGKVVRTGQPRGEWLKLHWEWGELVKSTN